MAWIGKSHGTFRLHDSDRFCGSYLSVADAAEILAVSKSSLALYAKQDDDGNVWVSELDLHKRWGAGETKSPYPAKIGSAQRSFDELILVRLLAITYPAAKIDIQVPFGRKRADISVEVAGERKIIEFLGPAHFIQHYQKPLRSPFDRKQEIEETLGCECVLWPYWMQRCSRNIRTLFEKEMDGLASVWSTKAHFGDFQLPDAAKIIIDITQRFRALRADGIGYMYLNEHSEKPIHPIVDQVRNGIARKEKLIPRDNPLDEAFWIPSIL
jgi:hypothetical protein